MGVAPEFETLSAEYAQSAKPLSQGNCADIADIAYGIPIQNEADEADLDADWDERVAIAGSAEKLHKGAAAMVADACHPAPFGPEPEDWGAWFAAETAKRAPALGPEGARRRVAGIALNLWNIHHGERGEANRCAGCGGYLPPSAAFTLGDGATIHAYETFMECLIAYGNRWRPAALAGLQRLGLAVSEADL